MSSKLEQKIAQFILNVISDDEAGVAAKNIQVNTGDVRSLTAKSDGPDAGITDDASVNISVEFTQKLVDEVGEFESRVNLYVQEKLVGEIQDDQFTGDSFILQEVAVNVNYTAYGEGSPARVLARLATIQSIAKLGQFIKDTFSAKYVRVLATAAEKQARALRDQEYARSQAFGKLIENDTKNMRVGTQRTLYGQHGLTFDGETLFWVDPKTHREYSGKVVSDILIDWHRSR